MNNSGIWLLPQRFLFVKKTETKSRVKEIPEKETRAASNANGGNGKERGREKTPKTRDRNPSLNKYEKWYRTKLRVVENGDRTGTCPSVFVDGNEEHDRNKKAESMMKSQAVRKQNESPAPENGTSDRAASEKEATNLFMKSGSHRFGC